MSSETAKTILVIDDEAPIRRVLSMKFEQAGYRVLTAADGEEGAAIIHAEEPDIVVADITMPKLDGRALCELTNPIKAERPFLTVIVTGRIARDERDWVASMDQTEFMEKPFSPSKLVETAERYFRERGA